MKKVIGWFCLAVIVFSSCNSSEDEGPTTNPDQNTAIEDGSISAMDEEEFKTLIDGGNEKIWSASAFTLAGQTTFTSCRLDDIITFNSDSTYVYDGGEQLCGAEDDSFIKTGTWEADFENKTLVFDKGTPNEEIGEIIGLSDDEIRVKGSYMMMEVRGVYTSN